MPRIDILVLVAAVVVFIGACFCFNVGNVNTMASNIMAGKEFDETWGNFSYDSYNVTYEVKKLSNNKQNISVTLTNTTDKPIYNWGLEYVSTGQISSVWNASIQKVLGGECLVTGKETNSYIEPHKSITFGYTLTGNNVEPPTEFLLSTDAAEVMADEDDAINVEGFTSEDLEKMEEVNYAVEMFLNNESLGNLSTAGKRDNIKEYLTELATNGTPGEPSALIKEDSISYDWDKHTISFEFIRGGEAEINLDSLEYNKLYYNDIRYIQKGDTE